MLFHHYGAAVTIRIFRNGVHKDPEDIILGQNVSNIVSNTLVFSIAHLLAATLLEAFRGT